MEASLREVNIKTISGEVKVLQVPADLSVLDFKSKVFEKFNVPVDRQRLICQGKLLKDEHLISEYLKEDGQTVHLMVRAEEAPPGPSPNAVPNAVPNVPPPQGMPFQLDQMLASMMGNFFPGSQIFASSGLVPSPPPPNVMGLGRAPPASSGPSSSNLPNVSNPPNQPLPNQSVPNSHVHAHHHHPPAPGVPHRNAVEISLPFERIQNIGNIVNELHGPGASFPPPRMPQLPVPRNPLVLLGGFLYNYQLQMLRLLPFISRLADLMQRESLVTDPHERAMMQNLGVRVGHALNELVAATTPITGMIQNLQIGPAPGQFQLRFGNIPVATEVRNEINPGINPVPNQPVNPPPSHSANLQPNPNLNQASNVANPIINPLQNILPNFPFPMPQGMGQPPQANMLAQFLPMLTQMLGGDQNMTLHELLNSLQMHDEEESLPMMEFFYNLNLTEIIGFASGNWEAIERQRPTVQQNLLRLMENDTPEGRMKIVNIITEYMQRQYAVPDQFVSHFPSTFSVPSTIQSIGERWLMQVVNLVMDYQGPNFVSEFKKLLELMVGNYSQEVAQNMQGGVQNVMAMFQIQLQNGMARIVPPEFSGLIGGAMGSIMNAYVTRAMATYQEWQAAHRTQEESKEAPVTQAGALLASWQETIERDLKVEVSPQRPFSRSYLESDVFTPQINSFNGLQQFFFRNLQNAFNTAGVSPVPNSTNTDTIQEFFANFADHVRNRIRNDSDFRSGRFEYLDRIRK